MSNRIDLTQFEGMVEDLGEPCLNQDKMPLGNEWLIPHIAHLQCGYGMESDDLEQIRITVLAMSKTPDLIAELKRCYEVMNEVILRAMDAREEEVSDIIKHGDEEYVHVDEITYPFSKSDIDAALDSKASE